MRLLLTENSYGFMSFSCFRFFSSSCAGTRTWICCCIGAATDLISSLWLWKLGGDDTLGKVGKAPSKGRVMSCIWVTECTSHRTGVPLESLDWNTNGMLYCHLGSSCLNFMDMMFRLLGINRGVHTTTQHVLDHRRNRTVLIPWKDFTSPPTNRTTIGLASLLS